MRDYVLTLLVAAAVTYLLTPLVRRLAGRVGAMKQPRERDVHVVPIPTLGGLAMFGGLAAGLLAADQIPQLQHAFANTGMVSGLLLAGGLLVVIGFIDDRWGMAALPKAAGQVAAGGILVATGTTLSWIPLPGGNTFFPTQDQATVLTILIVVATINAVNFIDGLDGLAAGLVGIAAISFFAYYYVLTKVVSPSLPALAAPALASAILIGMCLGFLPHNFSPAKIFMGDTGAMLLGLLLAYAPISGISSLPQAELTHQINRYPVIMPLIVPAALLVIPYGDLLLAVVRRTRAGRSPFAPDRKHLHHRLLDIGHSQRTSVLIMYLWAAVFSGIIVWLSIEKTEAPRGANHHGQPIWVFVLVTVLAVVVLMLMSMPRLRWWQRPRTIADGSGALADPGDLADLADAGASSAPAEPAPLAVGAAPVASPGRRTEPGSRERPGGPAGPPDAGWNGTTGSGTSPGASLTSPDSAGSGLTRPGSAGRDSVGHDPGQGSALPDTRWPESSWSGGEWRPPADVPGRRGAAAPPAAAAAAPPTWDAFSRSPRSGAPPPANGHGPAGSPSGNGHGPADPPPANGHGPAGPPSGNGHRPAAADDAVTGWQPPSGPAAGSGGREARRSVVGMVPPGIGSDPLPPPDRDRS